MTSNWEIVRLGDVAETLLGKTLPRGAGQTAGGAPYLRNVNVQWGQVELEQVNMMAFSDAERAKYDLRRGDILVCEGGEIGRLAILERDLPGVYFQNAIHRVRANLNINPWYLAMSLEHLVKSGGLEGISTRVTIAHLNQTKLRDLRVALPPLAEQQRIVDLIGALDDATKAAEGHSGFVQKLYLELLIDAATLNAPRLPLGQALTEVKHRVMVADDEGYRIAGLERSGLGFIDRGIVSGSNISYPKLTRINAGQLVYRKLTAWEGPIAVADSIIDGAFVSPEFPVFEVDDSVYSPELLGHLCRWPGFWDLMAGRLTGSVLRRKRLNPNQLLEIELPMPQLSLQRDITERLDAAWEASSSSMAYLQSLQALRSEMLTSLLSGAHAIPESYDEIMVADREAVNA